MMEVLLNKALFCFLNILVFCFASGASGFDGAAASSNTQMTSIPLNPAHWKVIYDGFGKVSFENNHIHLKPSQATSIDKTHAALVELNPKIYKKTKNFYAEIEYETLAQLRIPAPNDWEVFWFFFNTQIESDHFKSANYFIHKPSTGVELGRAWSNDEQLFIHTDNSHSHQIQKRQTLRVEKVDNRVNVKMLNTHNQLWMPILNIEAPPNSARHLFNNKGSLALYTEDAEIIVYDFKYLSLDP